MKTALEQLMGDGYTFGDGLSMTKSMAVEVGRGLDSYRDPLYAVHTV